MEESGHPQVKLILSPWRNLTKLSLMLAGEMPISSETVGNEAALEKKRQLLG
jgi:hypothetical protein